MKYKILLKSFIALAIIVTFSTQVDASEVTGNLSSDINQNANTGTGSEVSGTLSNSTVSNGNTLSGSVVGGQAPTSGGGGFSGGGGSSSGSGGGGGGTVLGASTGVGSGNLGQVLGVTSVLGFPSTGIGFEANPGVINTVLLILLFTILIAFSYYRIRKNA